MKSAKEIFAHIIANPQNKVFEKKLCFMRLKSFLPKSFQEHIMFMYDKGDTLFFVLDHPAYKQEFHYKATDIKALLKNFKEQLGACGHIAEVKAFVSHKALPKEMHISKTEPRYKEHSKGVFENSASDEQIKALFEEIRGVVNKNRTHYEPE